MRVNPARLALENYPFSTTIELRYGDVDGADHINNVAFGSLVQEARIRFQQRGPGDENKFVIGARIDVAANTFTYLHEGSYPEPVTIGLGVSPIGRTSFTLSGGIFQSGKCILLSETVSVAVREGGSFAIPEVRRKSMSEFQVDAFIDAISGD